MLRRTLFSTVTITLLAYQILAITPRHNSVKSKPLAGDYIINQDQTGFNPEQVAYSHNFRNGPADTLGQVFLFGNTWLDYQHNGTSGRQIAVDPQGWVHIAWMNGLNAGSTLRHIYYQLMDNNGNIVFNYPSEELGVQVDATYRAGYTTLVVYPDGRAMPVFHQCLYSSSLYHVAIACDFFPHCGAFMTTELPPVYVAGEEIEVIWPKSAIDIDGRIHIVSTENVPYAGAPQGMYYGWGEYDPFTYIITTCDSQLYIDNTTVIAADIAASPVSNRVAVGRMKFCASQSDTNYYDNNLIVCISEDGLNWNWQDTINVTNWIPPDSSLLPDTALANRDTLRCFTDMCLLFDYSDVLHIFFSTRAYYYFQQTLSWGNGFIWHWDEVNQLYSMVADGWFDNGYYEPGGGWDIYAQRPSAAAHPTTGEIYCLYQRYLTPVDTTLPFPHLWADTTDFSAAGYPNAEIFVTKSTDGGLSWAEGTNITETHSPNALPGYCLSEEDPSMALQIYNDNLHIFYILDKDAGFMGQTWTYNDVDYHRVATNLIASAPLLPPYPMHCDSTGMPGVTQTALRVILTPAITPIQIPAHGGSFDYNIEVCNQGADPVNFEVWTKATLPSGFEVGPLLGPFNLTLPGDTSANRDRTQSVPAHAPTGIYTYDAYVGIYPDLIYDEDQFVFEKMAISDGGAPVPEWNCWGEDFDNLMSTYSNNSTPGLWLNPASPNPFNLETTLSFYLNQAQNLKLSIYDIQGREVCRLVNGRMGSGYNSVRFKAGDLASGIYFARLMGENDEMIKKLVLLK